jgi:hypothetical protein
MSDTTPHTRAELEAVHGTTAVAHSARFRKVSNRYPHMVAMAYGRDLERAARDTDEQVAATVAAWEREQGFEPRDWVAIGADERDDDEPEGEER